MGSNAEHERLVYDLLLALSATGVCKVWKQPTGAAYRDGKLIYYGKKGSADISGILNNGRRIEIECKTGKARQTKDQKNFHRMIVAMGGVYIIARDVQSVVSQILHHSEKGQL